MSSTGANVWADTGDTLLPANDLADHPLQVRVQPDALPKPDGKLVAPGR